MTRGRAAGALICVLIALSLTHGLAPRFPAWPAGLAAWLVGALLVPRISRLQRWQAAAMAALGSIGIALAHLAGERAWLATVLEGNQGVLAMLATVSFLRVVTRTGSHPHEVLPRGRAALYRTLLATHLISAVVNISAVFIVGQRIALDGSLTPLQAKVVSRAFVAAACWSPLFAAMAVILHYVPGVDMLAVASTNLLFAAMLVGWSAWALGRDPTVAGFVGYPLHREALVVPLVLAGLMLAIYAAAERWSILTVIVVAAAACVALLSCTRPPAETRRLLLHHVERELPRMGGEFALFLGAAILAAGVAGAVRAADFTLVYDPVSPLALIPLLFALVVLILAGVHPVISLAALASVMPASPREPDLIAMTALMAWSIGLGTSPFSGTTLALAGRFGMPATAFLRWNLPFLVVGLGGGCLLLGGLALWRA